MAFKQLAYSAANAKSADPSISDDVVTSFTNASTTIANALGTKLADDYYLQGVTLKDLLGRIGTSPLDMWQLRMQVACILPDIFGIPSNTTPSKALNFMELVLFTIAPATRQIKAGHDQDKHWNIRCYSELSDVELVTYIKEFGHRYNLDPANKTKVDVSHLASTPAGALMNKHVNKWKNNVPGAASSSSGQPAAIAYGTITISTFKSSTAPTTAPEVRGDCLMLTMKQASLIALDILNNYTSVAVSQGMVVLTPLAGAIFSRNSLKDMLDEPAIKSIYKTEAELSVAINSSAQSGGQHLPESRADIAGVCAYVATSGLTDKKLAESITNKTVRQYISSGRPGDHVTMMAFAKYATGGVPTDLSYDKLSRDIPAAKLTYANARAMASQVPKNQ